MNLSASSGETTSLHPPYDISPSASSLSSVVMATEETPSSSRPDGDPEEMATFHLRTISPVLFGSVCTLTFFGLVLATVFFVFNLRYRNDRLIKMSSPNLNVLITIGTALLYVCAILLGIDSRLTSTQIMTILCKTRLFLLVCGFTLVYGSLFSKAWRVYRIFAHTGANRMVIRDNMLIGIIACLLLLDAFIMAIWLIFDPPECQLRLLPVTSEEPTSIPITSSEFEIGGNPMMTPSTAPTEQTNGVGAVHVCHSRYQEIWLLIIYAYKSSVLLYGTHLSWATRNVALTAMNDARCIIISVYTCAILVSLTTALSMTLWQWPNVWYACLAFVLLTCTTEVLVLLHVPKIRAWKDNPDATMPLSRTLTSSYIATNHCQSFSQVEEELFLLSAENAVLKRSLSEKDETIKQLQNHVGMAKEKLSQLIVDTDGRHDSGCDFDGSSATSQEDPASIGTEQSGSEKSVPDKHPVCDQEPCGSKQNSPVKKKKRSSRKSKGTSTNILSVEQDAELTVIDLEDQDRSTAALVHSHTGRRESLDVQHLRKRRTRDRASSLRSIASTSSQFEELRNCIVEELHQAQHISSNLRDAIAQDLVSCRQRPMYYDMARTEEEIMSSLSKSYRLGDDDAHSVVSSTFTYDNPVFSRDQGMRRSNSSLRTNRTSRQSSFRSVASIALEIAESYTKRDKNGNVKERELQWPSYIPPKESKVRSGEPLRVVRSSEAPIVYTRRLYNTYV